MLFYWYKISKNKLTKDLKCITKIYNAESDSNMEKFNRNLSDLCCYLFHIIIKAHYSQSLPPELILEYALSQLRADIVNTC